MKHSFPLAAASASKIDLFSNQEKARKKGEAKRVADASYSFKCCAICGLQLASALQVAHLDHNAANNNPQNLVHLCPTHHGMYDANLYPVKGVILLRDHWQRTQGKPDHTARMKDAGPRAAATRKRNQEALAKAAPPKRARLRHENGRT